MLPASDALVQCDSNGFTYVISTSTDMGVLQKL